MTNYSFLEALPAGFFDLQVENILSLFREPTLIYLQGQKSPPLFVSILLHGNEYSGLKAVQALLRQYNDVLPRSMYLYIGNVTAAAQGLRVIPGQTDYNRCWPGTEMAPNDETRLMQSVVERVTREPLFAAIDVHNNSGFNPHYAGITSITEENRYIAAMFNHIGMAFRRPRGVSTMAFDNICPAATLECGRPGEPVGIQHATELLDAMLHMDHFPEKPLPPRDLQLLQTVATVKVPDQVSIVFDLNGDADLVFQADLDRLNFNEIKPNQAIARTRVDEPLTIISQSGEDITTEIIRVEGGNVFLNRTLIPAMITLNETIVRQDCLCHLMEDFCLDKFPQDI